MDLELHRLPNGVRNALDPKPIRCIKATHPLHSIAISIDHCLDCGEFRKNRKAISNEECDMNYN
jgi:hypothetical protein